MQRHDFNPRTHEGCDFAMFRLLSLCRYFNPRTHEGCDGNVVSIGGLGDNISIHAPMKGAT